MKNIITTLIVCIIASNLFASNADLFSVNQTSLDQEFAQLTELENFVVKSNYMTLSEIQSEKMYDLTFLNAHSMSAMQSGSFVFEWEGFLWGFLCCPVGFFVIAINSDKEYSQKISYWIGVGAGVVIGAISSPYYYSYW